MKQIKFFTAIMKVAEVCNIDCDYCYYYNIGDDSWKQYPPYMSEDVLEKVVDRFEELLEAYQVGGLNLVFHGGEPLMARSGRLEAFIERAKLRLAHKTRLEFSVQTNGTILSDEWISFFARTGIQVGVSVDGPSEYHDAHRRTKQDKPTLASVEEFAARCNDEASKGSMKRVGTISVVNPMYDVRKSLDYIRKSIRPVSMSFIMPDDVANDILLDERKSRRYGDSLIALYEENIKDRSIRSKEVLKFMARAQRGTPPAEAPETITYVGITIQSNGHLKVNEELIATGQWRRDFPYVDLMSEPIEKFIEHPRFQAYLAALAGVPEKCTGCRWAEICRGGSIQERKRPKDGFNERSALCRSYMQLYDFMYEDLMAHGFPKEELDRRLFGANTEVLPTVASVG